MQTEVISFFIIYSTRKYRIVKRSPQDIQTSKVFSQQTSLYQESVTDHKMDDHDLLLGDGTEEELPRSSKCLRSLHYFSLLLIAVGSQGRQYSAKKYGANKIG
jgi:hypothetical protein